MGQYKQWLLAQEIDQRLKIEIESLETELLYLKERISILEQTVPESENMILHVLVRHFQEQASEEMQQPEAEAQLEQAERGTSNQDVPLQPVWNALPKVETPQAPSAASATYFPAPPPQTGYPADDMQAFFEERRPTDPRFVAWRPDSS